MRIREAIPLKRSPGRALAAALVFCRVSSWTAFSAEVTVEARVVYETPDGLYIDAGKQRGLKKGDLGTVLRDGSEIGRVEVAETAGGSSRLRVLSATGLAPRAGDQVVFQVTDSPQEGAPPAEEAKKGELKGKEEPFVPLLMLPQERAVGYPDVANIFHGHLGLRQLFQVDSTGKMDYSMTRFLSAGSVERIEGTPWSFEWSGDVTYRAGEGLSRTRNFEEPRFDLFRLSLQRRFEDGGFFRAGRFLPLELPGLGYVDGAQVEEPISKNLRVGGVLGFKPSRIDLDVSGKEPMVSAYVTAHAGMRQNFYYSGTLGVLGSLFEGKADRLALLLDQRADLGPKLSLYSTSEVDFDIGAQETRSKSAHLTRTDLYVVSPITSFLTLRAGLDHYERPDTAAERDLLHFQDNRFFDWGYWRYWVGSSQMLPWALRLDEEVAVYDAPHEHFTPRWRVSASRLGLFALPRAEVSVTLYNLDGAGAEGYGGLLAFYFPALEERLSIRPAAGFRFLDTDDTSETFRVTDISLRADWWLSSAWSVYGGVSYTFGDDLGATLVDFGIDFRW
jgi:hypothetical protein